MKALFVQIKSKRVELFIFSLILILVTHVAGAIMQEFGYQMPVWILLTPLIMALVTFFSSASEISSFYSQSIRSVSRKILGPHQLNETEE